MSFEIREPRVEEAQAIADLLNRHAQAVFGETEIAAPEVRQWFKLPKIWLRVAARDDELVGYLDAVPRGPEEGVELDARALDRDVLEELLRVGTEHARPGRVRAVAQGEDSLMREVLEGNGWKPWRSSYQMRIALRDDVPEPCWPDGTVARPMRAGEERRVYEANNVAFRENPEFSPQPFEDWASYSVDRDDYDPSLWWLAEVDGELAGFSVNAWHFSGDPEFGWIGILGVLPAWRRRGLGTALLQQSFRDFRERGATLVGLGVDAENTTGAVRLYERVGMHVHRRNDTYEKVLS